MLCCGEKMAKKGVKPHKKSSPDYRAVRFARQFFAVFPNCGAWTVATVLLSRPLKESILPYYCWERKVMNG